LQFAFFEFGIDLEPKEKEDLVFELKKLIRAKCGPIRK